jgi:hypothetical protein
LLAGQASTADFLASLGSTANVLTEDQAYLARQAFAATTNPGKTDAERQKAILALKVPEAVRHLAGMLSEYDWDYVEQAKQIRGYVVAKIMEETKNGDPRIRLRSLELLGKLTGIDSFSTQVTITHKNESADELEQRIRTKLATLLPKVVEVQDVLDKEE